MRLELTRVGLLVKLANRYTTKGAPPFFLHHQRCPKYIGYNSTIEMQRSHKEMNCHSQKLQCYMYNLNTLVIIIL